MEDFPYLICHDCSSHPTHSHLIYTLPAFFGRPLFYTKQLLCVSHFLNFLYSDLGVFAQGESNSRLFLVEYYIVIIEKVEAEDPKLESSVAHDEQVAFVLVSFGDVTLPWDDVLFPVDLEHKIWQIVKLMIFAVQDVAALAVYAVLVMEVFHEDFPVFYGHQKERCAAVDDDGRISSELDAVVFGSVKAHVLLEKHPVPSTG